MKPVKTAFYLALYVASEVRKLWSDIAEIINAPAPEPLECHCRYIHGTGDGTAVEVLRVDDCPIHGIPTYLADRIS